MAAVCRLPPLSGNRYQFRDDNSTLQRQLCQLISGHQFDPLSTFSYHGLEEGYGRLVKLATDKVTAEVRKVHPLNIAYVPTKKERIEHAKIAEKNLKKALFGGIAECPRAHLRCLLCSQLRQVSGIGHHP
jgi:hypothetical protein